MVGTDLAGSELVAVRADDLDLPARGTEVRGDGVWACVTWERPAEHWSVGLESFGAAFDDPVEAWGEERGDVVPFGLDLEWEATEGPWCTVEGDVLIGSDRIEVGCTGSRVHRRGGPERGWRVAVPPWTGGEELSTVRGADGLPLTAVLHSGGSTVELAARRWSPVRPNVVHALCQGPGPAWGWVSWWGDEGGS